MISYLIHRVFSDLPCSGLHFFLSETTRSIVNSLLFATWYLKGSALMYLFVLRCSWAPAVKSLHLEIVRMVKETTEFAKALKCHRRNQGPCDESAEIRQDIWI